MVWRPDYITLAELKGYLRIDDAVDDVILAVAISAASRAVDKACNRQFGWVSPEVRYYKPRYDDATLTWVVDIDDLGDITGATVNGDTPAVSAWGPRNALALGDVYTQLAIEDGSTNTVAISARWGWSTVPVEIKQATLIQASRFVARRDSAFGVAGSAEAGSELRLMSKLDPDVAVLVRSRYRWWGAY